MQTTVENIQARRMRVSSRNHLRRRNRREVVRARMVRVQIVWGISRAKRIPGMVWEGGCRGFG